MESLTEAVLVSIRKIIRNSDLHSHKLRRDSGLTSPQLMLLTEIAKNPDATIGELAELICLSQATATTVLDRLEKDGLADRYRSDVDKRKVHARLTEKGVIALKQAPKPLHSHFIEQFENLKPHERSSILAALQHVGDMMEPQEKNRKYRGESPPAS
jgi:DNA-binding MarR family transcriptional regulator